MKRNVIIGMLATSLLFSSTLSFAASNTTDSVPVNSSSVSQQGILNLSKEDIAKALNQLNIIRGTGKSYNLDQKLTRAEAAVLMASLLGEKNKIDNNTALYRTRQFKDVKSNVWYEPYVAFALKNNIMSGYGNGSFGPNDEVTQKQFLKMLLSAMKYEMNKDFS